MSPPAILDSSPLRISEIHFYPRVEQGRMAVQFLEIANVADRPVDISEWSVRRPKRRAEMKRIATLPAVTLAPGAVVVLCRDVAVCEKLAGGPLGSVAAFGGMLKLERGYLQIVDPEGHLADAVSYSHYSAEVTRAMGTGLSIHRADYGEDAGPACWHAAEPSPGKLEEPRSLPAVRFPGSSGTSSHH